MDVFIDRVGWFMDRVIISSPANEVLETPAFAAAVEEFGNFIFRHLFDKNRRRRVGYLTRQRNVGSKE
jgi:hypothetical protein